MVENIVADPQNNFGTYQNLTGEVDAFRSVADRFLQQTLSPGDYHRSSSDEMSDGEKVRALTTAIMKVPFDYLGNAIKTAHQMESSGVLPLEDTVSTTDFHYLRTPLEVGEDYLRTGNGGDCFSTSVFAQLLFAEYGLESRLILCYDNPQDQDEPKKKHHCAVLVNADGKEHYVDTSLNIETPLDVEDGDSKDESSIFRLNFSPEDEQMKVSYVPKATFDRGLKAWGKTVARNVLKGPVKLWYFDRSGNGLDEVLPSMLYTLHPEVPASTGNRFNRNQQLRINALRNSDSGLSRERVFYHEAQDSYLSRPIRDQVTQSTKRLNASHNPQTGKIEGDKDGLVEYISKTFKVDPKIIQEAVESLDEINERTLTR